MKFTLSWLKEFIEISESTEKLGEILTLLGLEVDAITPIGTGDFLFEVAITPNLIHANSVFGIARELSAVTKRPLKFQPTATKESGKPELEVSLKSDKCPRYALFSFKIQNKESPDWLKKRLEEVGFRPKNFVVDVTNYVMHELGQPLHAFDYDKIEGKNIIVREAKKDEKIVLLDGREIFLLPDTLVIADSAKPLAIAGIMGGTAAEVTEGSSHIAVEAAFFDPSTVRKSSKKLGISTNASYYFERGTDPNILEAALARVAKLLNVSFSHIVERGEFFASKKVSCRLARVNEILGTNLALAEVETLFHKLGFKVRVKDETVEADVPAYRHDVKEEIDLIEEVARLYGYNNIFKKESPLFRGSSIGHNPALHFLKKVRFQLFGEGLQEILTCNLIGEEEAAFVSPAIFPKRSLIKILNPMSFSHSVMRPSLLPNAIQVIKENVNHNISSLACFEIGKVHFKAKDKIVEPNSFAIFLTGRKGADAFWNKEGVFDFFDLKGILENLFLGLKIEDVNFKPSQFKNFHPFRQCAIGIESNQDIGIMGELHPAFVEKLGVSSPIYYAEIDLDEILFSMKKEIKMKSLPLYPSSDRDWTVTVKKTVLAKDLLRLITSEASNILTDVMLLDVYQSDTIGSDVKNMTFRFIYRDLDKTISFEEVEKEHAKIIETVLRKVNL